jgi:hypothetical protein
MENSKDATVLRNTWVINQLDNRVNKGRKLGFGKLYFA